jgi:hypothetical protein
MTADLAPDSWTATTDELRSKRSWRSKRTAPGLSFGLIHPVRRRSPADIGRLSVLVRTLANGGELWCAVLESVSRRRPCRNRRQATRALRPFRHAESVPNMCQIPRLSW